MRAVLGLVLALAVSGCGPAPGPRPEAPVSDQTREARRLADQGDYQGAAQAYMDLAASSRNGDAAGFRLEAADALLSGGQAEAAREILTATAVDPALPELTSRKAIIEARMAMAAGRPDEVLDRTRGLAAEELTPGVREVFHRLRAEAYEAKDDPASAALERSLLDPLISDPAELEANRDALWAALGRVPPSTLQQLQTPPPDGFGGWVDLALIARTSLHDRSILDRRLAEWRSRFPGHPANDRIEPRLLDMGLVPGVQPRRIALLLPFEGQFAGAAAAIRDGFLAAWFADAGASRPMVDVYNASQPDIVEVYRQAVASGAEWVVGPLEKGALEVLARQTELPVPTLALNQIQDSTSGLATAAPSLYQFALSPEDEARQIAERARFDGKLLALVLTPGGSWGERLGQAFRSHWQNLGGQVLEWRSYGEDSQEFSAIIQQLLNIDGSLARGTEMRNLLRRNLKLEPRRRQDADFIFLGAFPREARQMIPMLRYHDAAEIPVYATSHVYTGITEPSVDSDMDGLAFGDMPWLLDPGALPYGLVEGIQRNWPDRAQDLARLFAFGIDAYRVLPQLSRLRSQPYSSFEGVTGSLRVDEQGLIHRQLVWARFQDGRPILVDGAGAEHAFAPQ